MTIGFGRIMPECGNVLIKVQAFLNRLHRGTTVHLGERLLQTIEESTSVVIGPTVTNTLRTYPNRTTALPSATVMRLFVGLVIT